jgi:hypothetical protein
MESAFASTRSLLHRLAANAIQTGTVTSVLAIVTLLVFLTNPHSNLVIAFEFTLGRVYSLTLLYNLNQRRRITGSEKDSSGGFPERTHGLGPTNPITLTEIHVQCDVQTDGEDAIKSYPGTVRYRLLQLPRLNPDTDRHSLLPSCRWTTSLVSPLPPGLPPSRPRTQHWHTAPRSSRTKPTATDHVNLRGLRTEL